MSIIASLEVRPAAAADRLPLSRMLELYQHDLSDVWDQDLDVRGEYGYAPLCLRLHSSLHAMPLYTSPEVVVQRQLDAYNAKDLEAWLATYAEDAQQFEHPAKLLASGRAQIRARSEARFSEPDLHARLIKRTVMGPVVIDHEDVTRNFPEGPGRIELVCIYVVEQGLIQTASFMFGPQVLLRG